MRQENYLCSQCCTPYKSEKQAMICEKKCKDKKSCNIGITLSELENSYNEN